MDKHGHLRFFSLAVAGLMILAQQGAAEEDITPLASLIEAEKAFAAASKTDGRRSAFLANLATDAILFLPRPANGYDWYAEHEKAPGLLTWRPAHAEVAASGDMGFTWGPFEYRQGTMEDPPLGYGHFISVWRHDGTRWRVALDTGSRHEKPATEVPTATPGAEPTPEAPLSAAAAKVARAGLMGADRQYAIEARKDRRQAFMRFSADDIRLFRDGGFPVDGRGKAAQHLASGEYVSWQAEDGEVSGAGDLGYTYGVVSYSGGESPREEGYLKIWKKRGDGWRVVVDVTSPIP